MLTVGIWGVTGRMGQTIARLIDEDPDATIAFGTTEPGGSNIDVSIASLIGSGSTLPSVATTGDRADVVIDFSGPGGFSDALAHCRVHGIPLVSGSTGLADAQREELEGVVEIPVLWAPNTSFGVQVLADLVQRASSVLGDVADIEILESHHPAKLDAPSGTALALGQAAADGLGVQLQDVAHRPGSERAAPRTRGEIGFSVIRGGDVVGEHTVYFLLNGERIELTHRASDRSLFARGAIRAAHWIATQPPGRYSMKDLLD